MAFRSFLLLSLLIFGALEARPGFIEPWGKDSTLSLAPQEKEKPKLSLVAKGAEKIIWFHQAILSPVDGPRSHFRPTSSQYMKLAIYRWGFFKGYIKGCDRREDRLMEPDDFLSPL